jgi:hypothetical protein
MKTGSEWSRALSAILLIACLSSGALAADPPSEETPETCTARNSQRATVAQIATDSDAYEGECVAVDATMHYTSLFDNVDGVYVEPPDSTNPSSSGLRIGLDNISRHSSDRYRGVSVVGRVQDCETVRNCVHSSAGENEIVMISGYCHYYDGAYLWVHDLKFRRAPAFVRHMGDKERDDYGDLAIAPPNWLNRAKVEALADEFLQALRTGDGDKLADLHFRNVGLEWEDDEAAMLKFLLKDRRSPFSAIRTARTPPQRIILVEKSLLEEQSSDEYTATVCFCREKDCTGRWPIATFDADNISARPYACTRVEPYVHGQRDVPHFTTEIGSGGLAEP